MISKHLWVVLTGAIVIQIAAIALFVSTRTVWAEDSLPPADFFAGSYTVIGQRAVDEAPYAGTAVIEAIDDERFMLALTIDGTTTREYGWMDDLAPLLDATVLNLHDDSGMIVGSCLWTVDLDNYPRLTCLRKPATADGRPGREAYFPDF